MNKNATFKIVNADNKELTTRKMLVSEPKGLQTTYAYRDEVLKTIQD
ncbi:MAG: hypothetical protein LBF15_00690 [Candidatus Peribacteria bacterium]|nr:hypothetical protein [Candidatus Peribacteria bacterium]